MGNRVLWKSKMCLVVGGDDETLSRRLRYRGRRMGDRVREVGGVFGRGGDQYEICSPDSEHVRTG